MKYLIFSLAMVFSICSMGATDDGVQLQLAELNECVLAVGFGPQTTNLENSLANGAEQIFCVKNTAASGCEFVIYQQQSKKFDLPLATVPVACANGGFKQLLSQKIVGQGTVRDALYDGPANGKEKPIVLRLEPLQSVVNFIGVYKDFHQDGPGIQPLQKTAGSL